MRVILGNLITAIESDGTVIRSISWDAEANELNIQVDPIGEERAAELAKQWFEKGVYSGESLAEVNAG